MNPSTSPAARPGVCVFCGSCPGVDPAYMAAARALGGLLADGGFDIVYGAAAGGCMGALADAALAREGRVIGVAPPFLASLERRHQGLTRFELVEDLAARKKRMLSLSVGAIVLPGGTGTLDEFLEILTMKRLGQASHHLIVVDVAGFFRPLHALLQHLIDVEFAGAEQKSLYLEVDQPLAAVRSLRALLGG